jgi:lipid A 3-O-deacylase
MDICNRPTRGSIRVVTERPPGVPLSSGKHRTLNPCTFLGAASRVLAVLAVLGFGSHASHAQSAPPDRGLTVLGDEPSYVDLGVGAFDIPIHRGSVTTVEGRGEFRYGQKLLFIGPAIGVLGNGKGGVYGYVGFYSDIAFDRFVITPLAGFGAYRRGDGPDLGGTFEFRLSINAAYEFSDRSRLGLQIAHISNGGLHRRNPDDNELLVTYAFPLSLPF